MCFRLDVKEPPVSTIGASYETVDERCRACCMYGGPDGTCEDWPEELQRRKGRPCPRVDLDPSLALEAEVLGFVLHADLKRLSPSHFQALAETYELDPEEQLQALRRVHAALAHPDVLLRLHPPPPERTDA